MSREEVLLETVMSSERRNCISSTTGSLASRIADLILQVGLDMEEISRLTGVHRETIRYRYKREIEGRGLLVQAIPDYGKLDLERVIAVVRLRPDLEQFAPSIFAAMHKMCYLTGYWFVVPSGKYVLQLTAPKALVSELLSLLEGGIGGDGGGRGVFSETSVFRFQKIRSPPMMTQYFDFREGAWSFDWSLSPPRETRIPSFSSEVRNETAYDFMDLLLLSELGVDAGRPQVGIAERAGVKTKTLGWHHCEHLLRRRLIKSYRIAWMRCRYDEAMQGVTFPRNQYIPLFLFARDIDKFEMSEVSSLLNGLPFLWEEAFGDVDYSALLFVPTANFSEFLNRSVGLGARLAERLRLSVVEPSRSCLLALPYQLFDRNGRTWQLDAAGAMKKFQLLSPRMTTGF